MSTQPPRPSGRVHFCGLTLAHPVINGSGTFDVPAARLAFGEALDRGFPFAAFVSKTITPAAREGNPPPRLWETAGGLVNSIGLPGHGLRGYIEHDLPALARLPVPLITNVMGASAQEIAELFAACQARPEIAAVELNVSCPNVKTGLDIGSDPETLRSVLRATRSCLEKPLIVKLTPNAADVADCAQAAQEGGADAVSLINTLRALALVPGRGAAAHGRAHGAGPPRPWLGGGTGGLSGPAVRAVALAQVAAVAQRVSIPVVGMGGVQRASHARELIAAGATLVAVGTESFRDPLAGARIAAELQGASPEQGAPADACRRFDAAPAAPQSGCEAAPGRSRCLDMPQPELHR
jgi:dihydroorotate dehydrogenase (NAD+) catalytic subunit